MGLDITGFGAVANLVQDGIDKIWPSKTDQEKAQAAAFMAQLQGALSLAEEQIKANQTEAASTKTFVAGWRPFIGWVCGAAFAWNFLGEPVLAFASIAVGHPVTAPYLDLSQMMPVLLGMLGLGSMRSLEKIKGVNNRHG